MSRDPALYLEDILEACRRIRILAKDKDQKQFSEDWAARDAILRNLEVIGEAVKCLPVPLKGQAPEIPWRSIVGFRNVLSHAYFGVDDEAVWDIVTQHLGPLENAVARFPGEESRQGSSPEPTQP